MDTPLPLSAGPPNRPPGPSPHRSSWDRSPALPGRDRGGNHENREAPFSPSPPHRVHNKGLRRHFPQKVENPCILPAAGFLPAPQIPVSSPHWQAVTAYIDGCRHQTARSLNPSPLPAPAILKYALPMRAVLFFPSSSSCQPFNSSSRTWLLLPFNSSRLWASKRPSSIWEYRLFRICNIQ